MSEVATRLANQASPQVNSMLLQRAEAPKSGRPLWPFTVRSGGQRRAPTDQNSAQPGLSFTT